MIFSFHPKNTMTTQEIGPRKAGTTLIKESGHKSVEIPQMYHRCRRLAGLSRGHTSDMVIGGRVALRVRTQYHPQHFIMSLGEQQA
jgi:hypothetical protein